ncbi:MAG: tetratricopeptide repeat protein [Pseudomonadota bacterium]
MNQQAHELAAPHSAPSTEMDLEDALLLAIGIHRSGELTDAEKLYCRILEVAPEQPDALHFLGVLFHQQGKSEAALELIRKSIAIESLAPNRHNNLGNVLVEMGRLAEATDAYRNSIDLWPDHADAHNNLGTVLKAQRQFDEAAAAYNKALELDPAHVNATSNMGNLLFVQGKTKEAVAYYCKAITLMPNHPEAKRLLGLAYYTIGEIDAAADIYRKWLAEEPNSPVAKHMLAACSGNDIPLRASDAYIEHTFDKFADSFDAKLERLAYRAPQLIAEALVHVVGAPDKRLVALDAGCGTGLCGPLIEPYVRRLVGVDLSAQMLVKARNRNIYDALVKDELVTYLSACENAYDLIVSADTLIYFGPLENVLHAASGALKSKGLLIFTTEIVTGEAVSEEAYCLNPHGRFSHGRAYLDRVLVAAGFSVLTMESVVLRTEGGKPVNGLVITSRKNI